MSDTGRVGKVEREREREGWYRDRGERGRQLDGVGERRVN